jgi:hypothetical protein
MTHPTRRTVMTWLGAASAALWSAPLAAMSGASEAAIMPSGREFLGELTWFNAERGFGFMRTPEGRSVFIHCKTLGISPQSVIEVLGPPRRPQHRA